MSSSAKKSTPTTKLCTHTLTSMNYRDADLVEDLIGKKTFSEVMFMQILGREPRAVDMRIMDAVLITLMEHGFTPSAIATRMIYMSAPENLQGAVAAGLMAVGSQFVGTMENNAVILQQIVDSSDPTAFTENLVMEIRKNKHNLPGFGHHLHKPDDPRSIKLLALTEAEPELEQKYVGALRLLSSTRGSTSTVVDITINATGRTWQPCSAKSASPQNSCAALPSSHVRRVSVSTHSRRTTRPSRSFHLGHYR